MIAIVPLLFCIAGLIVYMLANHSKVAEAGRLMFACGLLVLMFKWAGQVIRLL